MKLRTMRRLGHTLLLLLAYGCVLPGIFGVIALMTVFPYVFFGVIGAGSVTLLVLLVQLAWEATA